MALFTRLCVDAWSTKHKTMRVLLFNSMRQLCYAHVNVVRNKDMYAGTRTCSMYVYVHHSENAYPVEEGKRRREHQNDIATAH